MLWLKQSTAITLRVGPFVDDTDFKTAETGLTIAQADCQLSKAGAAFAQKTDATGGTHDTDGWYSIPLDATDTGTLGALQLQIAVAGALPVWMDFMVQPANVYDSLVAGSDTLQADATQISGDSTAADNLELMYDGTGYAASNSTIGTVTTLTGHTAQTGDSFARLGAPAGVSVSADNAAIKAETALIVADTNELQTDDVPGLIAALNDPTVAEIWDLADGIETGITPRSALKIGIAALAGVLSGAATTTITIKNARTGGLAGTKDRIVATVDADGNRSAITLDLT